jgi:predicted hotdog family 3-hydroxylacyl-ACP dehydratase
MLLGREEILALIPHQEDMCLLDGVITWDGVSVLTSSGTHRSPANPLKANGRMRAIHLCEYGAQAMAVHGGLLARAEGRRAMPGLLVSLRDVALHVDYADDLHGDLLVCAERLHADGMSWQYAFRVTHQGTLLVEGRAAVIAVREERHHGAT